MFIQCNPSPESVAREWQGESRNERPGAHRAKSEGSKVASDMRAKLTRRGLLSRLLKG